MLRWDLPADSLLHHWGAHSRLPSHPELGLPTGIRFSSGRLGHLWPYVNGVALAHPGRIAFCLGAKAPSRKGMRQSRPFAVAHSLNVKLVIGVNDLTIAGDTS